MTGVAAKPDGTIAVFDLERQRPIALADIGEVSTPVWVHFDRFSDHAASWLRDESGLDDLVVETLLAETTRPTLRASAPGFVLILRGVNLNPGAVPEDMVSIRMWIDHNRVVSLQGPRVRAIDDVIDRLTAGGGPTDSDQLACELVTGITARIGPVIEVINDSLDTLEDRVVDPEVRVDRHELITMRRRMIALHRYLAPQTDALTSLLQLQTDIVDPESHEQLLTARDRMIKYVEDLDAARRHSAVVQDELANQLAERMNHRVYTLTIIAAIFLPLSLVTGLLGMNVGGIPGVDHPGGFAIVTVGLVVTGLITFVVVQRRHGV